MKNHKSICLYAHFNSSQRVADYVFTYLQSISLLEFDIIFISNSFIKPEFHTKLLTIPNCKVFERENKGGDFGAWSWALENNIIPDNTDYLLLTNDSIYGPIFPLEPIFETMQSRSGIDFWGLTDNYQGGWHIQSYFLCLSKKAFTSNAFKKIFSQNFSVLNKLQIIKVGEVQLTKSLSDSGFKGAAYIPYSQLNPDFEEWDAKNPTHFFGDYLIEKFNFPFVKKELIFENPEHLHNVQNIFDIIEQNSQYPVKLIKESFIDSLESSIKKGDITKRISVVCHIFYPVTFFHFLSRIIFLKSYNANFIFNIAPYFFTNKHYLDVILNLFPSAIFLHTPNTGRDIGGKLAAIDVLLKLQIETDYTLVIHDKLSLHTPTGVTWRDKLFVVIEPETIKKIISLFEKDVTVGIIAHKDLIQNEYNPDSEDFTCTSSAILVKYLESYCLKLTDYNFSAGNIFWIRTSILKSFFSKHPALSVRKSLEKGNTLDFTSGTHIHAWERMFSFISNAEGYKIKGI